MRRLLETVAFLGLAVGLHVAIAIRLPSDDGSEAGGQGGQALVSLQGAAPGTVEMVKRWETPPDVTAQPDTPEPMTAPSEPAPVRPTLTTAARPAFPAMQLPDAMPDTAALPKIETDVPPPPEPEAKPEPEATPPAEPEPQPEVAEVEPSQETPSLRPQARPADLAPPEPQQAEARPKPSPKAVAGPRDQQARAGGAGGASQRAAGSGGSEQAGNSGGRVKAGSGKHEARLEAVWGSQIRTRIERKKQFPGGLRGQQGRVVVRITVARDGTVLGASVVRSSGVAAFDQAALNAISRSGRMPSAPRELSDPRYAFNLPMDFS